LAECSADLAGVAVASVHENVLATRARPLATVVRIDALTAKASAEFYRVLALRRAEDVHVRTVSIKRGRAGRATGPRSKRGSVT
jgi:hypothetical protein